MFVFFVVVFWRGWGERGGARLVDKMLLIGMVWYDHNSPVVITMLILNNISIIRVNNILVVTINSKWNLTGMVI